MRIDKLEATMLHINYKVYNLIEELNLKKEDHKYFAMEEQFKKLKQGLHFELNTNTKDQTYEYNYHMEPVDDSGSNEYKIITNIINDYELVAKYTLPFTIVVRQTDAIDCYEVKDTSLYDLLYNTPYEDELINFQKQLVEYETECTLSGEWTLIAAELTKPEREYFRSLNDHEKEIFAKGHSFTYVSDLIYCPSKILFNNYDIEFINTFFDKIKFVK